MFAKKTEEVFGSRVKAVRGTALYNAQVEHCYMIDEIQRGPTYMVPKAISAANEFITSLEDVGEEGSDAQGCH